MVDEEADKQEKKLSAVREHIMLEIRNNPNITQPQRVQKVGIGKTAVQNHISYLKKNGYIKSQFPPQKDIGRYCDICIRMKYL